MIRTEGKVFDAVQKALQARGFDTDTLQVVNFGQGGSYRDIMLNGEHIGSYECNGKTLNLLEQDKAK